MYEKWRVCDVHEEPGCYENTAHLVAELTPRYKRRAIIKLQIRDFLCLEILCAITNYKTMFENV